MVLLEDFFPVTLALSALLFITGLGFLKLKPWGRVCAFIYMGVSVIAGISYSVRFVQFYGTEWVAWLIVTWIWTLTCIGFFIFYLTRPGVKAQFQRES